jgi:phospholipid transport system substrate-binding protein
MRSDDVRSPRRRLLACASALLIVGAAPLRAYAAETDPAIVRIQSLDDTLTSAAKSGTLTSPKVREALREAFNLSVMAQVAVGAPWASMTEKERAAVVEAMSRYTEARYAREFRDFNTQTIVIDPVVQTRGPDRLVRAEIREKGEPPLKLGYRLRDYGGQWRIIDVIYNGVSQLATQRSEFAETIRTGGAAGLVKSLDQATARLK